MNLHIKLVRVIYSWSVLFEIFILFLKSYAADCTQRNFTTISEFCRFSGVSGYFHRSLMQHLYFWQKIPCHSLDYRLQLSLQLDGIPYLEEVL